MKKKFIKPSMKTVPLITENLMVGSGGTGDTIIVDKGDGTNPPVAEARRNTVIKNDEGGFCNQ